MLSEICKDLYCSGDHYKDGWCLMGDCVHVDSCNLCHRKWPTPEQFEEEYGAKYPYNAAAYVLQETSHSWWTIDLYERGRRQNPLTIAGNKRVIICACTPFGKPDSNWRPK